MKDSLRILATTPWAIAPEFLPAIADVLEFRLSGVEMSTEDVRARIGTGGGSASLPSPAGGVAVIPIRGVISPEADEYFGGVTPDAIGDAIDRAMAADGVATIVLAIDSPGGSVYGVPELAEKIAAYAKEKRIISVATGMMASAAYYIGSAATEVVTTPSGQVGSIGVFTMHADLSRMLQNAGIDVTIIKAGKYKAEGNPFGPLSDDARDAAQARIDDYYDAFVSAVARHRGVTAAAVRTGFGEGRVENARAALRSGMVDRIASLETVLGELAGKGAKRSTSVRATADPPDHSNLTTLPIAASAQGGDLVFVNSPTGDRWLSELLSPSTVTAAAGGPAVVRPITPSAPAPKAKENTVSDTTTAAQHGADTAASFDALMALAETHGKPVATVRQWIAAGKTVAQVQQDILAEYAQRATPLRDATDTTLRATNMRDREAEQPFASLGEQLQAIARAGMGRGTDKRLLHLNEIHAAASGGVSHVGSDGGFLIQHQFTADLVKDAFDEGVLLSRVDSTEIGANSNGLAVTYVDETSRATGSRWGGVQVYNVDEADTVTASRPKLERWELQLGKKMGLAYMTEELLEDAPAMQDIYSKAFRSELAFKCDDEIFRGKGGAQFTGVLPNDTVPTNGPAISVAKETGQLADTIVAENVQKMWARVHPRSKMRGVWFINTECTPQLQNMQIGTGTSGTLVYMPPGGISGSPFGTIYGRPVIEIEYAAALGDLGDICFLDLSLYKVITKGAVRESESMHVRFLYDEMAFKWTQRINGAPKLKKALTPYKGASGATLSPFVFLAARA